MKIIKIITFIIIGMFTIIGCNNKSEKKSNKETTIKDEKVIKESGIENKIVSFYKELTLQNITFDVTTKGEGSIQKLFIIAKGLTDDNQEIDIETDGKVIDAEVEDLNNDGYPELLVYTKSAGSGSYGNVIGYSVNGGKSISAIYFPPTSENPKINKGYMGHDEFQIIEKWLLQRFPVYNDGDANSSPTGGKRQVKYKLVDGESSRRFVVIEVDE